MSLKPVKKAFLLCAGRGQRFEPHTCQRPKVLLPFLNVPLAAYNLFLLKSLGVQEVIANVSGPFAGRLGERLKLLAHRAGLSRLELSYEDELLGSAGGLWQVRDFFQSVSSSRQAEDYFFYLNGDSLIEWPGADFLQDWQRRQREYQAIAGFLCHPSLGTEGVLWAQDLQLGVQFLKPRSLNGENKIFKPYHFCGLALLSQQIFKYLNPSVHHLFLDVLNKDSLAATRGFVHSVKDLKTWDMNQLSSYLEGTYQVLKLLLDPGASLPLLRGALDLFSPGWRIFCSSPEFSVKSSAAASFVPRKISRILSHTLLKRESAEYEKDIVFCGQRVQGLSQLEVQGFAVLGDGCRILAPCRIRQSVVQSRAAVNRSLSRQLLLRA